MRVTGVPGRVVPDIRTRAVAEAAFPALTPHGSPRHVGGSAHTCHGSGVTPYRAWTDRTRNEIGNVDKVRNRQDVSE